MSESSFSVCALDLLKKPLPAAVTPVGLPLQQFDYLNPLSFVATSQA